jgi:hypothetical protein
LCLDFYSGIGGGLRLQDYLGHEHHDFDYRVDNLDYNRKYNYYAKHLFDRFGWPDFNKYLSACHNNDNGFLRAISNYSNRHGNHNRANNHYYNYDNRSSPQSCCDPHRYGPATAYRHRDGHDYGRTLAQFLLSRFLQLPGHDFLILLASLDFPDSN